MLRNGKNARGDRLTLGHGDMRTGCSMRIQYERRPSRVPFLFGVHVRCRSVNLASMIGQPVNLICYARRAASCEGRREMKRGRAGTHRTLNIEC